jgi:hypothetical protein
MSSLHMLVLVDDRFDDRSLVSSISWVADLTDAPNPDVVPFGRSYSVFTVYRRQW